MWEGVITEADTCREFVTPQLIEAGWVASPHAIGEQHSFTSGRIIVAGGKVRRGMQRRAGYLSYFRRDYPLTVVKVKEIGLPAETGVQQAREYAGILGLKFAYATNVRHRRLQPSAFLSYEMSVPSMATQLRLREVYRRTQALKAKHTAIRAANAALLPATLEQVFS